MASKVVGNMKPTSLNLKFEWEINYFSVLNLKLGDYLESPKFMWNCGSSNIQLHIRLYREENKPSHYEGYFIFYLHYDNSSPKKPHDFRIFNAKGEDLISRCSIAISGRYCEYHGSESITPMYGRLVSRKILVNPANGILQKNKLKFLFEISVEKEMIKSDGDDVLLRLEAIKKYEALLEDSNFSDLTLISEGKEIKVHKYILAKSSSVFATMFKAEMKEKRENIVEITDIKYDVLAEMIRFIYAGKFNYISSSAIELAIAADKYELDGLKNACEKSISENLTTKKIIDCLQLADRLRMDKLKEQIIEFIVEKASDIADKPEFDLLPNDIVRNVCRRLAKKK